MPMVDCESHGLVEAAFYCAHVEQRMNEGAGCEVGFVFDDLGDACLLCSECLVVARAYVKEHQSEKIDEYPVQLKGGCIEHLDEWGKKTMGVDLSALLDSTAKRTRRRPER